jgi:hypothetical protein
MRRSTLAIFSCIFVFTAAAAVAQISPSPASPVQESPTLEDGASCPRSLIFTFEDVRDDVAIREVPVWQMPENSAFFFETGMNIDADGAPNAYNAENTGLDDLSNAGQPGHWDGVVQDENGNPYVQSADDPFPGFFISCTALSDRSKSRTDPTRYVDASRIPYVVLPGDVARKTGARLGDMAVVFNLRNGRSSYAIFADIGTMGEGSVALARNLGIREDARDGGARQGIRYLVFPGSGNGQPRPVDEITTEAEAQLEQWGGAQRLTTCPVNKPMGRPNPNPSGSLASNTTQQ